MITVIHGPMACGKTHNKAAFIAKYPHANFLDDWFGGKIPDDTLVLTFLTPPFKNPVNGRRIVMDDVRVVSFEEAMK